MTRFDLKIDRPRPVSRKTSEGGVNFQLGVRDFARCLRQAQAPAEFSGYRLRCLRLSKDGA